MHIAIDARMYGTAQRGIGRYLMKLIEALEEIEFAPPLTPPRQGGENWYTIFLRQENFEEYHPKNPNFKKALWDAPWYGWQEQITSYELGDKSYEIVHFPHWNVPLLFRRPFIVTIHDLELFSSNRTRNNSTHGRALYWFKHFAFRIVFRHAVLASRAIIVPSNVVREQLLDRYPQVRKKVRVIYEAPTLNHESIKTLKHENKLPQRYALYVGAAYPHKNLPRLLEAWQILRKEFPEHKLVLVGREDFFWKQLKTTSYILHPTSSIIFYGSATDEELATLYKNAALLVQPSLEEGFSLSPLEAISFECPVAVSDIPIHHEILKDAALFFNPLDPYSIAETIKTILNDSSSKIRLKTQSTALLSGYSWKSHAHTTRDLYESIYKV